MIVLAGFLLPCREITACWLMVLLDLLLLCTKLRASEMGFVCNGLVDVPRLAGRPVTVCTVQSRKLLADSTGRPSSPASRLLRRVVLCSDAVYTSGHRSVTFTNPLLLLSLGFDPLLAPYSELATNLPLCCSFVSRNMWWACRHAASARTEVFPLALMACCSPHPTCKASPRWLLLMLHTWGWPYRC